MNTRRHSDPRETHEHMAADATRKIACLRTIYPVSSSLQPSIDCTCLFLEAGSKLGPLVWQGDAKPTVPSASSLDAAFHLTPRLKLSDMFN